MSIALLPSRHFPEEPRMTQSCHLSVMQALHLRYTGRTFSHDQLHHDALIRRPRRSNPKEETTHAKTLELHRV
jgi:hypothetical protein